MYDVCSNCIRFSMRLYLYHISFLIILDAYLLSFYVPLYLYIVFYSSGTEGWINNNNKAQSQTLSQSVSVSFLYLDSASTQSHFVPVC